MCFDENPGHFSHGVTDNLVLHCVVNPGTAKQTATMFKLHCHIPNLEVEQCSTHYYLLLNFVDDHALIAGVLCVVQLAAQLHSVAELKIMIGNLPCQRN